MQLYAGDLLLISSITLALFILQFCLQYSNRWIHLKRTETACVKLDKLKCKVELIFSKRDLVGESSIDTFFHRDYVRVAYYEVIYQLLCAIGHHNNEHQYRQKGTSLCPVVVVTFICNSDGVAKDIPFFPISTELENA